MRPRVGGLVECWLGGYGLLDVGICLGWICWLRLMYLWSMDFGCWWISFQVSRYVVGFLGVLFRGLLWYSSV